MAVGAFVTREFVVRLFHIGGTIIFAPDFLNCFARAAFIACNAIRQRS
jgi:hypothetical protein